MKSSRNISYRGLVRSTHRNQEHVVLILMWRLETRRNRKCRKFDDQWARIERRRKGGIIHSIGIVKRWLGLVVRGVVTELKGEKSSDVLNDDVKMREMATIVINMPRAIVGDNSLTKSYIPKVFETPEGPYYTDISTPDEIHQFLRFERVESNRTIKSKSVTLTPNQVLTKEVREDLKHWEELIRKNVFSLGGHRDHLPACLSYILYCILAEQQYNLAYFFVRRIDSAKATPKAQLPYGMFLTHLLRYVMEHYPLLNNDIYNVVDRVMRPLALRQTRKPRSDHGVQKARHSISSSSTHHFGSSSHQEDDDNDDGTSRASTPSPNSFLNSLSPLAHQKYNIPSSSQQTDRLLF
ncbi:hypothetical protein Tco_1378701 [Tanacetum coccineum]